MTGSSVTVPGTGANPVTVALGTGDVLHLATQIGALLSTIPGSLGAQGDLTVTGGTYGSPIDPAPVLPRTTVSELILAGDGTTGAATIPAGYNYVIDQNSSSVAGSSTISGSNLALITGTVGGTFQVTGQSTVAAEGGNNLITAAGQYLISTAPGNNTIAASGAGTVASSTGHNLIAVSGVNVVDSFGQDIIVAEAGLTTVNAAQTVRASWPSP